MTYPLLLADDDATSRKVMGAMLRRWQYRVTMASDGRQAWDALKQPGGPRLAVLDWMMPEMDGLEVVRRLREMPRDEYVYAIILTGRDQSGDQVAALDAGADDFLCKPAGPAELHARLRVGRRILDLQAELIAARERLRVEATHDALTGLLNRDAALESLTREISRAQRHHHPLTVAMLDIDHFKDINDTHGHLAGDEVLGAVAERLRGCVRDYDTLGRYGGEEFLVVLPACDGAGAAAMCSRLAESLRAEPLRTPEGDFEVTVSIGVTTVWPSDRVAPTDLVRVADEALYRAKDGGRNRVEIGIPTGEAAAPPGARPASDGPEDPSERA